MESAIALEHIEWLVWTEIPIKVTETSWCGAIIWEEWGPKLKTCPNRWLKDNEKLVLNVNKFIQRMISHLKVKCKFWGEEYSRGEISKHWDECPKNKLKPVFINPALHPCWLYQQTKSNNWFWDGIKIIKHGCAKYKTSKVVHEKGYSWYCVRWDSDYCESWIQAYADIKDYDELRPFTKEGNMHLTHPHPLALWYGANLPEQATKNWYGKYKKDGCQGDGNASLRYL